MEIKLVRPFSKESCYSCSLDSQLYPEKKINNLVLVKKAEYNVKYSNSNIDGIIYSRGLCDTCKDKGIFQNGNKMLTFKKIFN